MKLKKIASVAAVAAMALSMMSVNASAAEEFTVFAMIGADNQPDDWQYCYWGPGAENVGDITAVDAKISDNGTATVSATLATPCGGKVWVTNPCLEIDVAAYPNAVLEVVECKINGIAVNVDYSVKDVKSWAENTGILDEGHCIRGAGYNEWGDKFIEIGDGLTSIEYTVKLDLDGDGYSEGGAAANTSDSTPASDSTTASTSTGNTSAAALAGVMAVAAAAAFAVRKSK